MASDVGTSRFAECTSAGRVVIVYRGLDGITKMRVERAKIRKNTPCPYDTIRE